MVKTVSHTKPGALFDMDSCHSEESEFYKFSVLGVFVLSVPNFKYLIKPVRCEAQRGGEEN
jgi:hypothetical protein